MGFDLRQRGVATINETTCTGCGRCAAICPDEIFVIDNGRPRITAGVFIGCIACGHCMAVCPTGSVGVSGRNLRPEDRFPLPPSEQRATAEQLEALLASRRSVRRFTPQEVPADVLQRILAMTSAAPMGIPPSDVGVVVFHGREKVQAFSAEACAVFGRMARSMNPLMLALMRPFIGKHQYAAMRDFVRPLLKLLAEARAQGRDLFTYDAPLAVLFHHGPMADPADCHIAATYAMLAAESLGLGSCMLGTAVAFNHDKTIKAKYGILPESKVGLMLAIGYPAAEFRNGVRRRLASVKFA